jgi:transcriptional regulator with XRE-family HTH domain
MALVDEELAASLRSWRGRVSPAEAGLPSGRSRRVAGLRREEVAQLAGVSVDYLARLEQGRASSPSPSVLAALARALRLTTDERTHLFELAGQAPPGRGTIDRHITPSLQRLLDRLADVPVLVCDAACETIACNPLGTALLGDFTGLPRRERNIAWRVFTRAPSTVVRTDEEWAKAEVMHVADLRNAFARHPQDEELCSLIEDLREISPRFAELWEQRPVMPAPARRKTFRHPEVGLITLDCEALAVQGSDLELIVYTATPGSPDADALALLATIGLQTFEGSSSGE